MAYDSQEGNASLRSITYDTTVNNIARQEYKFKQALTVVPSSSWKNFFYRKDNTVLAGGTGNGTSGIPRGAVFPQAVTAYDKIQSTITKFGLEQNIMWEDIISNDIAVEADALADIAQGVAKSVDDAIWNVLTENQSPVNIQSITIGTANTGGGWNQSSAAIIDNLMNGKQLLKESNITNNDIILFISPRDERSIVKWVTDKGSQFNTMSNSAALNGEAPGLTGVRLVISNSVTASFALMVVAKRVGKWRELVSLKTTTIEEPYRYRVVRAVEEGICELSDPKAAVLFIGTQLTQ